MAFRTGKIRLSDNIRQQLAFLPLYQIFQRQLAFLQPLYLQLIDRRAVHQAGDHIVQIPVLAAQFRQFLPERILIFHGHACVVGGQ